MKAPGILEPQTSHDANGEGDRGVRFPELENNKGQGGTRRWWVWLLVLAGVVYGCYALYQLSHKQQAEMASKRGAFMHPRSIPVAVATAQTGNIPVYLQGLGTVTAFNTVAVKTRVDGQLVSVNFREGQNVKQGDLLAQVDPRPYQVALESANSSLAQAKGNLARDQAALRDAQVNFDRYQQLYKDQIIAKQQLDTQGATADQARGSIAADQAAIATAEAAINNARLNLTYTRITAPISGRIGLRQVDVGNIIHAADTTGLAVITQLDPISVLFSIPEEQLPQVLDRLRTGAHLKTEAFDRDGKRKIAEGTLLTVDNQIDATTGTSRLKAVFPNKNGALFPNQFVNVRLALDTRTNVLIVPAVAIQRGPTGTFVYAVNQDMTVSVKPVKLGISEGNDVSIQDGLQAGDRVVVDGAEKLTEGMQVSIPGKNATEPQLPPDGKIPAGHRRRS